MTNTKFASQLQAILADQTWNKWLYDREDFETFMIKSNLDRIISFAHNTAFLFLELNVAKCTGKESI